MLREFVDRNRGPLILFGLLAGVVLVILATRFPQSDADPPQVQYPGALPRLLVFDLRQITVPQGFRDSVMVVQRENRVLHLEFDTPRGRVWVEGLIVRAEGDTLVLADYSGGKVDTIQFLNPGTVNERAVPR